jgi:predicted PolB exonuclease-like 3'-5' exonuclease
MLDQLKIGNILFLDIETVPAYRALLDVPEKMRTLWEKKSSYLKKENETPGDLYARAGIFAEFGKIICICTGMIGLQDEKRVLRLKSFYAADERTLLLEFADLVNRLSQKKEIDLCAHNGREFDFPYIARRMLINRLTLPALFDIAGKRPWEIRHIDTLELWKFGDHKHYTSLDLLTSVFEITSPKTDIDGSQVARVYWEDHDLKRIVEYCRRDVIAIAQLLLRFKGEEMLDPENIVVID